ncbi:VWA domain-containing protein [Myxococcota bacterium]|nr:VWA domain-containing protein [Myxococcota bacterium]
MIGVRARAGVRPSALAALVGSVLGAHGCTDASLYGKVGQEPLLADKVAFTGVLCTDNPATRKFPVKILFIVDASGQMSEAAPLGEHAAAIEQTLSQYLPIANVYAGFIRYDDGATQLIREQNGRVTSGFTRDGALIDQALTNLRNTTGARDLLGALSLARSVITGDAFQADRGPLSRTKYVVVHLTSSSPEPAIPNARCEGVFPTAPANCELAILEKTVDDLRAQVLSLGAAELVFHTVYLEQPIIEGLPCDPRMPAAATCPEAPGLVCLRTGVREDAGRCVQPCDPAAPLCTIYPTRNQCVTAALPDGTNASYCSRGETACFDGVDNDGDGRDLDCSELERFPWNCGTTGPDGCENECRSACRAEKLGIAMSLAGGGRHQRITSADQLTFSRIDFRSTQRLFVMKELFAFNRNAMPADLELVADSDADGLSDTEEDDLGLDALEPDSDGDYFGDKLEHVLRTLGLDPTRTTTIADCDDPSIDTDGDGLRDCEEKVLGSDRTLFDSDADGFPDAVELRMGTNPIANDTLEDLDLDGVSNGRELRAHTDVLSNDAKTRAELAYRPRITPLGPTQDQRMCYDVRISNVTLVNTRDRGFGPGNNDIDIYFGQVPEGSLESYGVFHVAQVRVQYLPPDRRIPSSPAIDLVDGDFVLFEQ